jgi:hypothetical protein
MSPTDAGRFTDAATPSHPAGHSTPPPPVGDHTSVQDDAVSEGALATDPGHSHRSLRHQWAQPGTMTPLRATTPATTVANDGRRCVAPRISTPWARRPMASDSRQLSAGMTATLSAELEGRVARDFVADIVQAVLDESRQAAQDRAVESMMLEARLRLERFIRARSSRQRE